jgi:membrane protease YdiL (CAAX protease family)
MFRGLLQTFFGRMISNPHVLIWIVAFLFSAMHLQFYGFITRLLLGAWLGYLMYYTKTIWIPVLAHITNNFAVIAAHYLLQNNPEESQKLDALGTGATLWLSAVSFVLFYLCFIQIRKSLTPCNNT